MPSLPKTRIAFAASGFVLPVLTVSFAILDPDHISRFAVMAGGIGAGGAAIVGGWTGRWAGHPGLSGWGKAFAAGFATMLIVSLAVWTAICATELVGNPDIATLVPMALVMSVATTFMPFQSAVSGLAVPGCIVAVHLIAMRERDAARPD